MGDFFPATVCWVLFLVILIAWLLVLIGKVSLDEFRSTTKESSQLLPVQVDVPEDNFPESPHPSSKVEECLKQNLQNVVPFFLSTFSTFSMLNNLEQNEWVWDFYVVFTVLVVFFVVTQLGHGISFYLDNERLRIGAWGAGMIINIILSILGVALGSRESQNLYEDHITPRPLRIGLTVVLCLLILKIYTVHLAMLKARYYSDSMEIYRLEQVSRNDLESFIAFAGIVSVWFMGILIPQTDVCTTSEAIAGVILLSLFAGSRYLHTYAYLLEKQPTRSIAFFLGILFMFGLGTWGWSRYLLAKLSWQCILNTGFMLVEVLRTWFISFATCYHRLMSGNYVVPEDCSLPYSNTVGDGDMQQINTLVNLQAKDNQLQLVFWFIMYHLGDWEYSNASLPATFFAILVFLFILSRCIIGVATSFHKFQLANIVTCVSIGLLVILLVWVFIRNLIV